MMRVYEKKLLSNAAIVILNYNDFKNTINCYQNAKKTKQFNKIVVVDNCSTDNSINKIKAVIHNDDVFIEAKKNNGYSAGNNLGIKYLESLSNIEVVFISNPDVYFDKNIVEDILIGFNETDYSLLTGIMYNAKKQISSMTYWDLTSYWDDFCSSSRITSLLRNKYVPRSIDMNSKYMQVDTVPGSFFAIRMEVLKSIGYFDENIFLYHEEDILAYKLKKKGYKVALITSSYYVHLHEYKKKTTQTLLYLNKSKCYYQRKYNAKNIFLIWMLKLVMLYGIVENAIINMFFKRKD